MEESIKNFNAQFLYNPEIINAGQLKQADKFVFAGMGGSGLAPGLMKIIRPKLDIILHQTYGLPELEPDETRSRLFIANSYSGNTEETVSFFEAAISKNLSTVAIATGGKLLEIAKAKNLPYIQMPGANIQPRMATGLSFRALAAALQDKNLLASSSVLAESLNPIAYAAAGKALAEKLKNKIPLVYASSNNAAIAYNWKIKFNETAKIPAFFNVFPELNHNEMTGFDVKDSTKKISENLHVLILKDSTDHPQIIKRMEKMKELCVAREIPVEMVNLETKNVMHKVFSSLLVADWAAFYTAQNYGVEAEQIPMVEEFKKLIQ